MTKRGFKTSRAADSGPADSQTQRPSLVLTPARRLIVPGLILLRKNIVAIGVMILIPSMLLQLAAGLVGDGKTVSTTALLGLLLLAVAAVWAILSLAASYVVQLQIVHGMRPEILETYRYSWRLIPRLAGLSILSALVIAVGLLLLIVPGLIAIRRYALAPFYLIEHDCGIREAMQRSAADSLPARRALWNSLVLIVTFIAVSIGLQKLSPTYGGVAGSFLTVAYIFILPLRYKEIALQRSALET